MRSFLFGVHEKLRAGYMTSPMKISAIPTIGVVRRLVRRRRFFELSLEAPASHDHYNFP